MIEIVRFVEQMNVVGCNKPFLGEDIDGGRWVGKAEPTCDEVGHLVRDYVGGRLALALGLPWVGPICAGRLSDRARADFDSHYQANTPRDSICVLSKFNPSLEMIGYGFECPWGPINSNGPFVMLTVEDRLKRVGDHLRQYLDDANLSTIFGRVVFDNWLAERDPMMDMVQLDTSSGKLICLDASTALNPRGEIESRHSAYQNERGEVHFMSQGLPLWAKAVLTTSDGFEPWLSALERLAQDAWDDAVDGLPRRLLLPEVTSLRHQTVSTDDFVPHFRSRVAAPLDCVC